MTKKQIPKRTPKGKKTRKKSEEIIGKIIDALKTGMTKESACGYAGIGRDTFYKWMNSDEEFMTAVQSAEDYWMALVENKKAALINKWYWPAIEKELKSRRRETYGDQSKIDVHHHDEEVIDESLLR